jgi:ABC-2 type transport system permease protein
MTALFAFYTESIWGISATKEAIILFLSGAVIPISFYPSPLKEIMYMLPFQAIYDSPLRILINAGLKIDDCLFIIARQLLWVLIIIILCNLWYKKVIKVLTINGG